MDCTNNMDLPEIKLGSIQFKYTDFDINSASNWTASFNSISLYVPTSPTNNNSLIVEVDYWPAENS